MLSLQLNSPGIRILANNQVLTVLVTGGAGFIGSAVVRHLIENTQHRVCVLDKLTYAGNLESLAAVAGSPRYEFVAGDICDAAMVNATLERVRPHRIMHLAAESHVDRSIDGPADFVQTNVVGTLVLLEASRRWCVSQTGRLEGGFLFHHVSTDEVYGDLATEDPAFTETTPYAPSSPYSASKAGSDHLARAWRRTYGLPVVLTNCSNNYGPFHFPEKMIPHMILNALAGKPLPVYGDGSNVRDWLYVDDHARALTLVAEQAEPGATYNIGGNSERKNIDVVNAICDVLERLNAPKPSGVNRFVDLVSFVADRPGHDRRYAIDARKIRDELGWEPAESFETGLEKTVQWYLDNKPWWQAVLSGDYRLSRIGAGQAA